EVPDDRQGTLWAPRVGRHERDSDRGPGEMARVRSDCRERPQPLAIVDDDEVPALLVLRAARMPAGIEDLVEVSGLEGPIGEPPDHPLPADGLDHVQAQRSSRTGSGSGL